MIHQAAKDCKTKDDTKRNNGATGIRLTKAPPQCSGAALFLEPEH
jgi:hypothetical protein